jgi:hypothetical protein
MSDVCRFCHKPITDRPEPVNREALICALCFTSHVTAQAIKLNSSPDTQHLKPEELMDICRRSYISTLNTIYPKT